MPQKFLRRDSNAKRKKNPTHHQYQFKNHLFLSVMGLKFKCSKHQSLAVCNHASVCCAVYFHILYIFFIMFNSQGTRRPADGDIPKGK